MKTPPPIDVAMDVPQERFSLSRIFDARIEESWRLRILGLAYLWLAPLGMVWTGGSPWLGLVAALGTLGHWLSWHWRHQPSRIRPLFMALLVIALSFAMRSQVLQAFEGNWLPMARFLLMVQALSCFDLRTRGGLYTSMAIGGTVLFFASQQSFNPGFGFIVVGFVVVLLSFLTVAFLEDGTRDAQVHWSKHWLGRPAMWPYWIAVACAVFTLSGVAFWLMPRGATGPLGPARVSILPYYGEAASSDPPISDAVPKDVPQTQLVDGEGAPQPDPDPDPATVEQQPNAGAGAGTGDGSAAPVTQLQRKVFDPESAGPPRAVPVHIEQKPPQGGQPDNVVFLVRTMVTSYWRGRTLVDFDGSYWSSPDPSSYLAPSGNREGVWYSQESSLKEAGLRYNQAFFVQQDQPDAVFMGYQGLRITSNDGGMDGSGVKQGDSYQVLSGYPQHSPEELGRDHALAANARLTRLPPGLTPDVGRLSERIIAGAAGDIEAFLSANVAGNALDFATATVVLARASELSSRLAVGYRPGFRDHLSGALVVRESDSHAWAEIFFMDHGWVPFDSTPTPDHALAGGGPSPLAKLFQHSAGRQVSQAVTAVSSRLAQALAAVVDHPIFLGLAAVIAAAIMIGRRLLMRVSRGSGAGRVS